MGMAKSNRTNNGTEVGVVDASAGVSTRFCMAVGPVVLVALALLSLGYCIYVWVRKAERSASWIGFLATAMSALVLVLLPSVVAIYIPLVDFLNRSTTSLPK